MARKQTKRQRAALKGWATRWARANVEEARKNPFFDLRSIAAKKGWTTRRARMKQARVEASRNIVTSAVPIDTLVEIPLGYQVMRMPFRAIMRRLVKGWFP